MKAAKFTLGKSVLGEPIERHVYSQPSSSEHILLLGGVHGDEVEGIEVLRLFQTVLETKTHMPCNIHIIPCVNPDGFRKGTRVNINGVDLNRNLPTKDWSKEPVHPDENIQLAENREDILRYNPGSDPGSEPENQALIPVIQERIWKGVISLHSYEIPMVNYNGKCSEALSKLMADSSDLPAKPDIGYPTPGSLGTWVGHEMKIPCVTFEIPKGMAYFGEWDPFVKTLWQVVDQFETW